MKLFLTLLLSLAVCFADAQQGSLHDKQPDNTIDFTCVDPLQKIFKETAFFDAVEPRADAAKGEHASFQFAVRSTKTIRHLHAAIVQTSRNMDLFARNTFIGFVGYTRVGRPLPNPPKDKLDPISGYYPDPILDTTEMDVRSFTTQPVWITVSVPVDFPAGDYTALISLTGTMDGKPFSLTKKILVKVYGVTISKTSLLVTNWFAIDKNQMKQLSGGKDSIEYSPAYWNWLKVAAKKMKEYDQNVIMTPVMSLTAMHISNQTYTFDFSRFDRFVQTFIDEGTLERIEGGHIGGRMGNWYAQFGVHVPFLRHDSIRFKNIPISDPEAVNFYKQFIPALKSHLKAKNWDKIYMQHVCDEPEPGNEKTYADIASFIKSIAPDLKLIDAVHSHGVNNTVDVWVPQLDFFDSAYSFYKERQTAGNEVWFYTCLAPQGDYANRYIEIPLIKTRILHWINFRFNATGYLHWGWDFWSENCFEETSGIITEAGNIMPGGDAFITYPGHGKILSSIRLEAMRDGIVDYELLKMLETKDSETAREICRQVVYDFAKYDTDIKSFRAKRRKILELLSL